MAYRSLLLFVAGAAMFGSTITTSLTVRENAAPSRRALLTIGDGASYVQVDLFRVIPDMEPAVKQLGFCNTYGRGVTTCDFTPGGSLSGVDLNFSPFLSAVSTIVLNGVSVPSGTFSDYRLSFTVNFYGGSPTHGVEALEWGPVPISADTSVALTRISEGLCVFCVNALNGSGTASGLSNSGDFGYSDYRFAYAVAGAETSPEPATFVLIGASLLLLAIMRERRLSSSRVHTQRRQ